MDRLVEQFGSVWFGSLCLFVVACCVLFCAHECFWAGHRRFPGVSSWCCNIRSRCRERMRDRVLSLFWLQRCVRCGSVVDLAHHSAHRCPGHLKDRVREADDRSNHAIHLVRECERRVVRLENIATELRHAQSATQGNTDEVRDNLGVWKGIVQDLVKRFVQYEDTVKGLPDRLCLHAEKHNRLAKEMDNQVTALNSRIDWVCEEAVAFDSALQTFKDAVNREVSGLTSRADQHRGIINNHSKDLTECIASLNRAAGVCDHNFTALAKAVEKVPQMERDAADLASTVGMLKAESKRLLSFARQDLEDIRALQNRAGEGDCQAVLETLTTKTVKHTELINSLASLVYDLRQKVNLIIPEVVA